MKTEEQKTNVPSHTKKKESEEEENRIYKTDNSTRHNYHSDENPPKTRD